MSYERPAWAGGAAPDAPPAVPQFKTITVDMQDFVRTRDALTSAFLGLSASLDRAVKAYLDHTQTVIHGDASLGVGLLMQPFNILSHNLNNLGNPAAQLAQLALQQGNGTVAPMMIQNGLAPPVEEVAVKGKRKKRAYKQRDPNAPKRPLTAYFRYLGENRGSIAEEIKANPELFSSSGKPGDISRVATDRWNALTTEQQEPYRNAYQAALKEYEKEVERYKASGGAAEALDAKVDDSAVGAIAVVADVAEDSSDDDEDEDAPIPVPVVVEKPAKKSALKKAKAPAAAAPAPVFSTINPAVAAPVAPVPVVAAASSSPAQKRKGAADAEGGAKKRSRKSAADKEVVTAAPDPVPVPVVAPSSPEVEAGGKKKKAPKKKKDA